VAVDSDAGNQGAFCGDVLHLWIHPDRICVGRLLQAQHCALGLYDLECNGHGCNYYFVLLLSIERDNMIGLSVSFCVRDIAKGEVALADVDKIIGSTRAVTPENWEQVIAHYKETYWSWDDCTPEKGEAVLRQLLAEGKIEQPRLLDDRNYPWLGNRKHWVDSEDEILWGEMSSERYDRLKAEGRL
jgi:hypothetical protein